MDETEIRSIKKLSKFRTVARKIFNVARLDIETKEYWDENNNHHRERTVELQILDDTFNGYDLIRLSRCADVDLENINIIGDLLIIKWDNW